VCSCLVQENPPNALIEELGETGLHKHVLEEGFKRTRLMYGLILPPIRID
jgi:hypothetical protein